MARYVSYRDGGKTNEEGIARYVPKFLSGNVFTGLQVTQQGSPTIGVTVTAGDIKIDSGNGYDYFAWSDASFNITLSTADGSNPRYDLIVAYIDKAVVSSASSNNPNAFNMIKVNGTPAGSPTEPSAGTIQTAVGAGNPYAILARVLVAAGDTTITNSDITDRRTMVTNSLSSAGAGWDTSPDTFTYASNAGDGEYTVTAPGDVTTRYSPGMKFRVTRGTAPPTQSTDLESSSSQYASDTSLTGITFTDDFTVEAWIKLESYAVGSYSTILARRQSSGGWSVGLDDKGRVDIVGFDTSGANVKRGISYQSVPLNKWVHVAATLDLSGSTSTIYLNGKLIASQFTTIGTITTITQTSDLAIGRAGNSSTEYFDGKIADVRLWNAIRTGTQIRDNMNIQLVGNETNLIGYWKLNGNFNDSTSNANNLTAGGGAVATNVDNPMNTIEYAEIIKASYSAPNTTLILKTAEGFNIPNLTLNSAGYSTAHAPLNFPIKAQRTTLLGNVVFGTNYSSSSTSAAQVPGMSITANVPDNTRLKITIHTLGLTNSSGNQISELGLWDGTVGSGSRLSDDYAINVNVNHGMFVHAEIFVDVPVAAQKTFNLAMQTTGGTATFNAAITATAYMRAEIV